MQGHLQTRAKAPAPTRHQLAVAERWPPGWGLLGAFAVSALMWWSIIQALRGLAASFMS